MTSKSHALKGRPSNRAGTGTKPSRLTLRMPADLYQQVEQYAAAQAISRTDAAIRLLREALTPAVGYPKD